MKSEFQNLARKNGQMAKVKAGRVAVILKLFQTDPAGKTWLRNQAVHLAKSVSYHLRQAALIGRLIEQIEEKERQHKTLDIALDKKPSRLLDASESIKA